VDRTAGYPQITKEKQASQQQQHRENQISKQNSVKYRLERKKTGSNFPIDSP
jgi:hypothetical protein